METPCTGTRDTSRKLRASIGTSITLLFAPLFVVISLLPLVSSWLAVAMPVITPSQISLPPSPSLLLLLLSLSSSLLLLLLLLIPTVFELIPVFVRCTEIIRLGHWFLVLNQLNVCFWIRTFGGLNWNAILVGDGNVRNRRSIR